MIIRLATKDDLPKIIELINSYTHIYGVDTTKSGLNKFHTELVSRGMNSTTYNVIVAESSNSNIVGVCVQRFFENCWVLQITYIDSPGNKFNASKIGGPLFDELCRLAEQREIYEFYYVVRDSGTKRMDMTLANAEHVRTNYTIDDIEYIPALTESRYEQVRARITGFMTGKNLKPLVRRHGKKKE